MPAFQYAALDAKGRQRKGLIEADTPRMARQALRERGLNPLGIEEIIAKTTSGSLVWICGSSQRIWHDHPATSDPWSLSGYH